MPAVIAAPMTSSEVLPAGISCPVTFWSGCAVFHAATICLPQATSCGLLEYQILIGPRAVVPAPDEPDEPLPHAASGRASVNTPRAATRDRFMAVILF